QLPIDTKISTVRHMSSVYLNNHPQISSAHLAASRKSFTSSPGLKAGIPINGPTISHHIGLRDIHPAHRNASPNPQLPQLLDFPCTVKSNSSSPRTTTGNFLALASSVSSNSLSPHVQSLHAFLRFPGAGAHSGG